MKRYRFVALVNATEGQDDAFNAWHTGTHMAEVLKATSFTRSERMKLVPGSNGDNQAYGYMVMMELETDDPMAELAKMGAAVQAGEIGLSDTLSGPIWSALYEEIPGAQLDG